ncbi:zinc ribbon domain-containing protein [Sinorhizobium meliloti]|uniref:zinc ribbon domain-containing protein n=1 Tax=Rhizobium meliloti TaxID=382 RepID=UPI00398D632E
MLLRDNHEGYISWREYEENHKLLAENAHMKKNCDRKSARGGRALLTGLMRCGRCGRMMRVFYGSAKGNAHRYQCRGDDAHVGVGLCIGIGGVRVDRAVAIQILEAVSDRAVEAAIFASDQVERSRRDVIAAIERDLEGARYEALLASRRYELVDPAKRHVARELEARWNDALERVGVLERKIKDLSALSAARPVIDRGRLLQLAQDLQTVWNAPSTETRTKQRLIHILVQEIICDLDDATNEAVLLIHWTGVGTQRCVWRASRPEDILPSSRLRPSRHCANWADIGQIGNSRYPSIGCFARQVMARAGRPCVFVTCASAWEFPIMMPPKWTYR